MCKDEHHDLDHKIYNGRIRTCPRKNTARLFRLGALDADVG